MPLKKTITDLFEKLRKRKKPKEDVDKGEDKEKQTVSRCIPISTEKEIEQEREQEREKAKMAELQYIESIPESMIKQWIQRTLDTGIDQLIQEYRDLAQYKTPAVTTESFQNNRDKNRYRGVPCQDKNRVAVFVPGAKSDYIHANYVGTPNNDERFICTQGPLESTVDDFWRMISAKGCDSIIMLCNCKEGNKHKCAQYWPNEVYGKRKVEVDGFFIKIYCKHIGPMSPDEPNVIVTTFWLSCGFSRRYAEGEIETCEVKHYHWRDFPARGVPACSLTMMEILSRVRDTRYPITVHCSNGIGRSSIPIAIEYILEAMHHERLVYGPEMMKELRAQRLGMINNELQYLYIHRILLHYLLEKKDSNGHFLRVDDNAAKYKKFIEDYDARMVTNDKDKSDDDDNE